MKKRKVLKEDGRYLIYFSFEQEGPAEGENAAEAGETEGLQQPSETEDGGQR